jgi:hypothetical protein
MRLSYFIRAFLVLRGVFSSVLLALIGPDDKDFFDCPNPGKAKDNSTLKSMAHGRPGLRGRHGPRTGIEQLSPKQQTIIKSDALQYIQPVHPMQLLRRFFLTYTPLVGYPSTQPNAVFTAPSDTRRG